MTGLRSEETIKRYRELLSARVSDAPCMLCGKASLKEFTHWRVTTNDFPYDKIAEVHHMLMPHRHVLELELTEEEWGELIEIKESYVNERYDIILEAPKRNKSAPEHFHLHLIVIKELLK